MRRPGQRIDPLDGMGYSAHVSQFVCNGRSSETDCEVTRKHARTARRSSSVFSFASGCNGVLKQEEMYDSLGTLLRDRSKTRDLARDAITESIGLSLLR
jgi:hypothetical protein